MREIDADFKEEPAKPKPAGAQPSAAPVQPTRPLVRREYAQGAHFHPRQARPPLPPAPGTPLITEPASSFRPISPESCTHMFMYLRRRFTVGFDQVKHADIEHAVYACGACDKEIEVDLT
jgi:hypothetical protein